MFHFCPPPFEEEGNIKFECPCFLPSVRPSIRNSLNLFHGTWRKTLTVIGDAPRYPELLCSFPGSSYPFNISAVQITKRTRWIYWIYFLNIAEQFCLNKYSLNTPLRFGCITWQNHTFTIYWNFISKALLQPHWLGQYFIFLTVKYRHNLEQSR